MKKIITVFVSIIMSSWGYPMVTATDFTLAGKRYRHFDNSQKARISEMSFGSVWSVTINGIKAGCFYEIAEEMEEGTEVYIYCPGMPTTKYILSEDGTLLTPLCAPSLELC